MQGPTFFASWWKETNFAHMRAEKELNAVFYEPEISEDARQKRYQLYLGILLQMHEEVEGKMVELRDDPSVAPLYDPRIFRVEAIKADLALLVRCPQPAPEVPALPLRTARIQNLKPHELVAAWFTLEMAYMWGGQKIKERFTGYESLKGVTNLYDYEAGIDAKAYREEVTKKLEELWPKLEQKDKSAFMAASADIFVDICQIAAFAQQIRA